MKTKKQKNPSKNEMEDDEGAGQESGTASYKTQRSSGAVSQDTPSQRQRPLDDDEGSHQQGQVGLKEEDDGAFGSTDFLRALETLPKHGVKLGMVRGLRTVTGDGAGKVPVVVANCRHKHKTNGDNAGGNTEGLNIDLSPWPSDVDLQEELFDITTEPICVVPCKLGPMEVDSVKDYGLMILPEKKPCYSLSASKSVPSFNSEGEIASKLESMYQNIDPCTFGGKDSVLASLSEHERKVYMYARAKGAFAEVYDISANVYNDEIAPDQNKPKVRLYREVKQELIAISLQRGRLELEYQVLVPDEFVSILNMPQTVSVVLRPVYPTLYSLCQSAVMDGEEISYLPGLATPEVLAKLDEQGNKLDTVIPVVSVKSTSYKIRKLSRRPICVEVRNLSDTEFGKNKRKATGFMGYLIVPEKIDGEAETQRRFFRFMDDLIGHVVANQVYCEDQVIRKLGGVKFPVKRDPRTGTMVYNDSVFLGPLMRNDSLDGFDIPPRPKYTELRKEYISVMDSGNTTAFLTFAGKYDIHCFREVLMPWFFSVKSQIRDETFSFQVKSQAQHTDPEAEAAQTARVEAGETEELGMHEKLFDVNTEPVCAIPCELGITEVGGVKDYGLKVLTGGEQTRYSYSAGRNVQALNSEMSIIGRLERLYRRCDHSSFPKTECITNSLGEMEKRLYRIMWNESKSAVMYEIQARIHNEVLAPAQKKPQMQTYTELKPTLLKLSEERGKLDFEYQIKVPDVFASLSPPEVIKVVLKPYYPAMYSICHRAVLLNEKILYKTEKQSPRLPNRHGEELDAAIPVVWVSDKVQTIQGVKKRPIYVLVRNLWRTKFFQNEGNKRQQLIGHVFVPDVTGNESGGLMKAFNRFVAEATNHALINQLYFEDEAIFKMGGVPFPLERDAKDGAILYANGVHLGPIVRSDYLGESSASGEKYDQIKDEYMKALSSSDSSLCASFTAKYGVPCSKTAIMPWIFSMKSQIRNATFTAQVPPDLTERFFDLGLEPFCVIPCKLGAVRVDGADEYGIILTGEKGQGFSRSAERVGEALTSEEEIISKIVEVYRHADHATFRYSESELLISNFNEAELKAFDYVTKRKGTGEMYEARALHHNNSLATAQNKPKMRMYFELKKDMLRLAKQRATCYMEYQIQVPTEFASICAPTTVSVVIKPFYPEAYGACFGSLMHVSMKGREVPFLSSEMNRKLAAPNEQKQRTLIPAIHVAETHETQNIVGMKRRPIWLLVANLWNPVIFQDSQPKCVGYFMVPDVQGDPKTTKRFERFIDEMIGHVLINHIDFEGKAITRLGGMKLPSKRDPKDADALILANEIYLGPMVLLSNYPDKFDVSRICFDRMKAEYMTAMKSEDQNSCAEFTAKYGIQCSKRAIMPWIFSIKSKIRNDSLSTHIRTKNGL